MRKPLRRATFAGSLGVALLGLLLLGPEPCAAQEKPQPEGAKAVAPAPAAKPTDDAPPKPPSQPVRRDPAGMVYFQGGQVKVGVDRVPFRKFVEATEVGRRANWELAFEYELSFAFPEHTVDLPPYWVGKYEVTNAQWHRFLEQPGIKVVYQVPPKGQPGDRTLEEISRRFLLAEKFLTTKQTWHYPVAVNWRGLYDLNEEAVNPSKDAEGRDIDPKTRPSRDAFQDVVLPPGTRITCYRYTVPATWSVNGRLRASPPPGRESQPVTWVSLVDAMAFARYYGCHIMTEPEWEASARGAGGTMFPEGKEFHPLGHAWKGFNAALEKAQKEATARKPAAEAELEKAKASGNESAMAKAQAVVDAYAATLAMKPLPDQLDPPCVEVGMFPFGRSPAGALDQIGNVDEWVSTPLELWPGSDSKSTIRGLTAGVLKGANLNDRDTLLCVPYRKFLSEKGEAIGKTFLSSMAGFRVARYEAPGASAASHALPEIHASSPPILPREYDLRSKQVVGPNLDIYGAVGLERLNEVSWVRDQPPQADPPGKVFYLGRAEGLCVVPATGTKFRDPDAIRRAATAGGTAPTGSRKGPEPRDIPFLGLLYLSENLELKAAGVKTRELVDVPLTAEEIKRIKDQREADRKEKAKKEEEPPADPPKDGEGGGDKAERMAGDEKPKPGKGGDGKPKDGDKPAEEPKPEGEGEAKDEEEDGDKEPPLPTHRKEERTTFKPGSVKGREHPRGLLLGFLKFEEENRAVLWEARPGIVGSLAPGGTVLLESPYAVLEKDAISFRKVSKPGLPTSEITDLVGGKVRLVFFVSVEGKGDASKRDAIEVTLHLQLTEFPPETANSPWVSTVSRAR